MRTIDCRGMACSDPVGATRKALEEMDFPLEIRVDSPDILVDVSGVLGTSGHRYQTIQEQGETRIVITGKKQPPREEPQTLWLITSYTLGRGSDQLGLALMKSFLHTLSETATPGTIFFLNSGVKLCAGPEALVDYMLALEHKDWQLKSCGTCLDYYDLKDQVKAGTTTNMFTIVQGIQGADKVRAI